MRISAKELELWASLVDSFATDFDPRRVRLRVPGRACADLIDAELEQGDALDTSVTFGEPEEAAGPAAR